MPPPTIAVGAADLRSESKASDGFAGFFVPGQNAMVEGLTPRSIVSCWSARKSRLAPLRDALLFLLTRGVAALNPRYSPSSLRDGMDGENQVDFVLIMVSARRSYLAISRYFKTQMADLGELPAQAFHGVTSV